MVKHLILSAFVVAFLLVGCGEEVSSPQQASRPAASPGSKKAAVEKTGAEVVEEEKPPVYAYNPVGKRDPFTSPMTSFVDIEGADDEPLTPLQRYDVEQYRLSGVVLGMSVPKAMVSSPDGKTYILKIGTKVGKNGGKVSRIDNDGVLVEETLRDFSGEIRVNTILIALPKRKGV